MRAPTPYWENSMPLARASHQAARASPRRTRGARAGPMRCRFVRKTRCSGPLPLATVPRAWGAASPERRLIQAKRIALGSRIAELGSCGGLVAFARWRGEPCGTLRTVEHSSEPGVRWAAWIRAAGWRSCAVGPVGKLGLFGTFVFHSKSSGRGLLCFLIFAPQAGSPCP